MTKATCTIEYCDRKHLARGLCSGHYNRWAAAGDSFDRSPIRVTPPAGSPCTIEACTRPIYALGLCNPHWQRNHLAGSVGNKPLIHRLKPSTTLGERVAYYSSGEPTAAGCIEWTGTRDRKGYGVLTYDGRPRIATRLVYGMAHGEIPENMVVRHSCDNPPCVAIAHLSIGSMMDNSRDMVERDRHTRGERSASAKVTAADVLTMRSLANGGQSHQSIANRYGLSRRHVGDIINRVCWKHI